MKRDILSQFLMSVSGNSKILATHISLFSAILCCRSNDDNFFNVSRTKLMELSKLRSTATYHKCVNDLINLGIINYQPSFNPYLGSQIRLIIGTKGNKPHL